VENSGITGKPLFREGHRESVLTGLENFRATLNAADLKKVVEASAEDYGIMIKLQFAQDLLHVQLQKPEGSPEK
jgi:hypothetical protein